MFLKDQILFLICMILPILSWENICDGSETQSVAKTSIVENRRLEKIHATQLKLSNGMTFCLKSTDSDSDEVFFKMSALGGYGSMNPRNFFSGKLADRIALESGMGTMTSDQFSVFLYDHALEFVVDISPFSRTLEGEGQEKSIEAFFQCVNMVFTEPKLTEKGFEEAISLTKNTISKSSNDSDRAYEAAFLRVNTQNSRFLRPLTLEDLSKVNFEKAKAFYHRSFSNPADFFCVITGNFDEEKVIKLIEKYIVPLPKPVSEEGVKKKFSVPFPP